MVCAAMKQFVQLASADSFEPAPGVFMRPLFGESAMINLIDMAPGASVPLHSHPHEQLGYMIDGEIVLTVDGVDHTLRPGDAYTLEGGVEHGAIAGPGGCRILDIFHPIREDYRKLAGA
jgi:quercetin dioxygenase-like cupin family protein